MVSDSLGRLVLFAQVVVFAECVTLLKDGLDFILKNTEIDPHFLQFYKWCCLSNIELIVISSGFEEVIRSSFLLTTNGAFLTLLSEKSFVSMHLN